MLSTCSCHFGGFFGFFCARILRRCRIASPTRTIPIAIFTAREASEGTVVGLGGLLPVARTVTATTMARETSQPNRNAAPLRTPRLEGSTMTNEVSGSGSRAIPTPSKRRSRTTAVLPPNVDQLAGLHVVPVAGILPQPGSPSWGGARQPRPYATGTSSSFTAKPASQPRRGRYPVLPPGDPVRFPVPLAAGIGD